MIEKIQTNEEILQHHESFMETNVNQIQRDNEILINEARELVPDITLKTSTYIDKLYKMIGKFDKTDEESCNKYIVLNKLLIALSRLLIYKRGLTKTIVIGGKKRTARKKRSIRFTKTKRKRPKHRLL